MDPIVTKWIKDPLERALWTFAQQFAVFLLATSPTLLVTQHYAAAADAAAFAAVAALITSYITALLNWPVTGWFDVGRRAVLTFLQSLAGTLAAGELTGSVVHTDWRAAIAIAVSVTMISLLKAIAALAVPDTIGASTIRYGVAEYPPEKMPAA